MPFTILAKIKRRIITRLDARKANNLRKKNEAIAKQQIYDTRSARKNL